MANLEAGLGGIAAHRRATRSAETGSACTGACGRARGGASRADPPSSAGGLRSAAASDSRRAFSLGGRHDSGLHRFEQSLPGSRAASLLGGLKRVGVAAAAMLLAFTAWYARQEFTAGRDMLCWEEQLTGGGTGQVTDGTKHRRPHRAGWNGDPFRVLPDRVAPACSGPFECLIASASRRALDALWQRYQQAGPLVQQIDNEKKAGMVVPANLASLTANQLARLSPEEFQRTQQDVNELVRQFRRQQVEQRQQQQQQLLPPPTPPAQDPRLKQRGR